MNYDKKLKAAARLLEVMDTLREKCPWDREQTIESLRNNTIEETYELADAIADGNMDGIKEELGDLLLHVVFYSKLGEEKGEFDFADVAEAECDKLIYNAKEEMYYYLKDHNETVNKYKACQDDEKVLALKEKLDAYVASDRGTASPKSVQVLDQPFGAGCKDNRHTIMQEFDRVPDEYRVKLGSGSPAKTRAKYLKAQENKKKQ